MNELSLNCNRCKMKVLVTEFIGVSITCKKSKCWIKTKIARESVAQISESHADDFLPIISGMIKIHPEPVYKNNYYQIVD